MKKIVLLIVAASLSVLLFANNDGSKQEKITDQRKKEIQFEEKIEKNKQMFKSKMQAEQEKFFKAMMEEEKK